MLAALCYSEFAAFLPVPGSAYRYTYATLGEALAWFIGWNLLLEYAISASTVAVSWSAYVVNLLSDAHIQLPHVPSSMRRSVWMRTTTSCAPVRSSICRPC